MCSGFCQLHCYMLAFSHEHEVSNMKFPMLIGINLERIPTPETFYDSIPDSDLYGSLVTETTPSSNTCPPYLSLDVNSILKPNTFDIAKMDEPGGKENHSVLTLGQGGWQWLELSNRESNLTQLFNCCLFLMLV